MMTVPLRWIIRNAGRLGVSGVLMFCVYFIEIKTQAIENSLDKKIKDEKSSVVAMINSKDALASQKLEQIIKQLNKIDKRVYDMHKEINNAGY